MSNTTYLVGADEVRGAGQNMRQAAQEMERAASTISEAMNRPPQVPLDPRPSWEYCYLRGEAGLIRGEANMLGAHGWEMVSVEACPLSPGSYVAFMKRKLG